MTTQKQNYFNIYQKEQTKSNDHPKPQKAVSSITREPMQRTKG